MDGAVSTPYRSISAAVDGGQLHGGSGIRQAIRRSLPCTGSPLTTATSHCWPRRFPDTGCWPLIFGVAEPAVLPGPWGIDRHAEDVAGLITASTSGKVVLVGHSMGGFVAAALVGGFPISSRVWCSSMEGCLSRRPWESTRTRRSNRH